MRRWVMAIAMCGAAGVAFMGEAKSEPVPSACFPARIGDLEAFSFSKEDHDALRRNRLGRIFGYNARPYRTALTVYLMDKSRSASVETEFRGAESEIVAAHPEMEIVTRNFAQIVLAGHPAPGQLGLYRWTKENEDVGSVLWIGESPSRIVKIRLSFVAPKPADQAAAAMQYAMNAVGDAAKHICEPVSSDVDDALKKPSPSKAS